MSFITIDGFIFVPRDFSGYKRNVVINGENVNSRLLECKIKFAVSTESVCYCNIVLNNNDGYLSNKYSGNEIIQIYYDIGISGTTLKFYGLIEKFSKDFGSMGNVINITGRQDSAEFMDILVSAVFTDTEVSALLTSLLNVYVTGYTMNGINTTTVTTSISWRDKPLSDCINDLCAMVNFDFYIDPTHDCKFFEMESVLNENEVLAFGCNIISSSLSKNIPDIRNRVRVCGQDENGLPIIYTTEDVASQDAVNLKELVLYDNKSNTVAECRDRSTGELTMKVQSRLKGSIMSHMLLDLNPGDIIWVDINTAEIHDKYRIGSYTQDIINLKTTINFDEVQDVSSLFKDRIVDAMAVKNTGNTYGLNFSYNEEFTTETGTHSNTIILDGALMLSGEESTGTWLSEATTLSDNMASAELKLSGQDLQNCKFYIRINGVDNEIVTGEKLESIPEGKNFQMKIVLTKSSTNTKPRVDSVALLYT